jgi:hypothetical protein
LPTSVDPRGVCVQHARSQLSLQFLPNPLPLPLIDKKFSESMLDPHTVLSEGMSSSFSFFISGTAGAAVSAFACTHFP